MEENEKELDAQLGQVDEPVVVYRTVSDRDVYKITNKELDITLVEISGYDLHIDFNMHYLKSLEDIAMAKDGIAQLFGEIITEKLLEHVKQ